MSHQHVNDAKILAGKRMIHFPNELRSVGYVYIRVYKHHSAEYRDLLFDRASKEVLGEACETRVSRVQAAQPV